MIDKRFALKGPVYAHDCDDCVFLGHYEGHDLYFCPKEADEGTVIARWSGDGPDYASGLPFGHVPLSNSKFSASVTYLRVAYLIAADLGYVPFKWNGLELWPETCKRSENE